MSSAAERAHTLRWLEDYETTADALLILHDVLLDLGDNDAALLLEQIIEPMREIEAEEM